jgi:hypothetical protein
MQGESDATDGYQYANASVGQTEDQMAEATIGALSNLATATASDRRVVASLAQANARLRELKALIKKERTEKRGQRSFNPFSRIYCWTHGNEVGSTHTSLTCKLPKPGHKKEATRTDNMGGSQANKE